MPGAVAAARRTGLRSVFSGKLWFWLPWPFLVALDLWSKAAVFAWMAANNSGNPYPENWKQPVFTGLVNLSLVTWGNPGTIWGLFQNGTVPLIIVRCAAIVALLIFAARTANRARLQLLVLSLIFAGAVGNLYDNLTRADHTVRDFLRFTGSWPMSWSFPAFNVADSCITVGAIGLLI